MKPIIPLRNLHYPDDCAKCGKKTDWAMDFYRYNSKAHKIRFFVYCLDCYEKDGDETRVWIVTLTVEEWLRYIDNENIQGIPEN